MARFTVRIIPWGADHQKLVVTGADERGQRLADICRTDILDMAEGLLMNEGHTKGDPDAGVEISVEVRPSLWTTIIGGNNA